MRVNVSITKKNLQLIYNYCIDTGIKRITFLTRSALKVVEAYTLGQKLERRFKEAKKLKKILDKRDQKVADHYDSFNPVPKPKKGKR